MTRVEMVDVVDGWTLLDGPALSQFSGHPKSEDIHTCRSEHLEPWSEKESARPVQPSTRPPRRRPSNIPPRIHTLRGVGYMTVAPSARRSLGGTRAQSGQVSATFQSWTAFCLPTFRCKPN